MAKIDFIVEPGKQEVVTIGIIDAPVERVFAAWTNKAAVPQWWGPRRLTTVVDKMDVEVGGEWRYVQRDQDGSEFAFHGVYHSITPNEKIIATFEFEGMPGHVILGTTAFEATADGKTKITDQSVFQSLADRDGMVATGMEGGSRELIERLEEFVKGE